MNVGDWIKNKHTGQILRISKIDLDLRNSKTVYYTLSDGLHLQKEYFLDNWTPVSLSVESGVKTKLVAGDYIRHHYGDRICNILAIYKTFTDHHWLPFVKVSKTIYLLWDGGIDTESWNAEQLHQYWQKVEVTRTVPVEREDQATKGISEMGLRNVVFLRPFPFSLLHF